MGILDVIIQVVKEQKNIFIGVIVFFVLIGVMIGFIKKKDIKIIELDPKMKYRDSVLHKITNQKNEEQSHNEKIDQAIESQESYPAFEKNQPDSDKIELKKPEPDPLQSKEPYRDSFNDSKLESEKPMDQNLDQALDGNKEKTNSGEEKSAQKTPPKVQKKPETQSVPQKNQPSKQKTDQAKPNQDKPKTQNQDSKNSLLELEKIPQKNKVEVYKN